MNLSIKGFPDEVARKIRIEAYRSGVTFREVVIHILRGWGDGLGEVGGAERAAGMRELREGVSHGEGPGREGAERIAEVVGASGGASTDTGAVGGGVRTDRAKQAQEAAEDEW